MSDAHGQVDTTRSLSAALREQTRSLHADAERSGIMRNFLRGRIDRRGYVMLLAALHPLYEALETALDAHPDLPVRFCPLYRTPGLAADLEVLHGPEWPREIVVAPSARVLADRIARLAETGPTRLAAHAYVRYLGDLSGGAALGSLVRRALKLDNGAGTAFYAFPPPDAAEWKARFRTALDTMGGEADTHADVVDEACAAFRLHITMFEEIQAAQDAS